MHCQELDMKNEQYQDLLNFLKNEIDQKWTRRKIKNLQKQTTNYQVKDDKLYYLKNDKLLKVVKDDQKEVILYMLLPFDHLLLLLIVCHSLNNIVCHL